MPKVAIIMGSDSDFPVLKSAVETLKQFGVQVEARVISAHRTPERAEAFAAGAAESGVEVIIAAAGKAAHLAGVLAARTALPVIGTVQMPDGIPVATVAINGAKNAALLAVQILSLKYPELYDKLLQFKEDMAEAVAAKDAALQDEVAKI